MSHDYLAARWDDLRVAPGLRTAGTNVPSLNAWQPGGSGSLRLYEFVGNATKEIFFEAQMPHGTIPGSIIKPHVHFSPSTTTATGVVRWQLEYTLKEVSGSTAFAAPTTIGGSYTFAANQQYKHLVQSIDSAAITLPTASQSAILVGRLFRAGGTSPDTFADSVFLLGFDIHFQRNSNGTVGEFS